VQWRFAKRETGGWQDREKRYSAMLLSVEKIVDYSGEPHAKNPIFPLVNCHRILIEIITPYLSAEIWGVSRPPNEIFSEQSHTPISGGFHSWT
jgi:hypothetical protein